MKKFIKFFVVCLVVLFGFSLSACSGKKKIIIGTMAQPGEPILNFIKDDFEKETGYELEIKLFSDFATPNNALAAGEIDANLFQHQPYLDTYNKNNKTNLISCAIMYDCTYGGYTKKNINTLDEIPNGSTITIANDASNMKRCLDILASSGLISVDYGSVDSSKLNPDNINDYIKTNEKGFIIKPISTSLIAASLDDATTYLGLVNATFAIAAGLGKNAKVLCKESDPLHKNANIVAIKESNQDKEWVKALVDLLTSEKLDQYVRDTFGTTITPYHG